MKITENLDISIKDYIGTMEGGITSLLSIIYNDVSFEGVYWYTDDTQVITISEDLEVVIDSKIEDYEYIDNIKQYLRESEAKFESIFSKLEPLI